MKKYSKIQSKNKGQITVLQNTVGDLSLRANLLLERIDSLAVDNQILKEENVSLRAENQKLKEIISSVWAKTHVFS